MHRHPCGGDRLAVAEKGVLGAGTVSGSVHRSVRDGAPPGVVRCHRRFSAESEGSGHGHRLGTAVPRAVHRPIFPESKVLAGVALGGHRHP